MKFGSVGSKLGGAGKGADSLGHASKALGSKARSDGSGTNVWMIIGSAVALFVLGKWLKWF